DDDDDEARAGHGWSIHGTLLFFQFPELPLQAVALGSDVGLQLAGAALDILEAALQVEGRVIGTDADIAPELVLLGVLLQMVRLLDQHEGQHHVYDDERRKEAEDAGEDESAPDEIGLDAEIVPQPGADAGDLAVPSVLVEFVG